MSEHLNNSENINNEQIDFAYYFSVILKHIWLLAGFILIGLVISVLLNFFMQPVYIFGIV